MAGAIPTNLSSPTSKLPCKHHTSPIMLGGTPHLRTDYPADTPHFQAPLLSPIFPNFRGGTITSKLTCRHLTPPSSPRLYGRGPTSPNYPAASPTATLSNYPANTLTPKLLHISKLLYRYPTPLEYCRQPTSPIFPASTP